jgi:hypothetical protein
MPISLQNQKGRKVSSGTEYFVVDLLIGITIVIEVHRPGRVYQNVSVALRKFIRIAQVRGSVSLQHL